MNRQTLADVLQDTNQTGSYTLATVLEGAEAGSQLLLRDGDALWQTQSAGILQRQLAVLQACTATGFLTLEGQRVFAERFGAVPQLVVCGGGHVAAALVKQAKLLGIPVLAIDDREEFAQQLRAAGADTVLCAPFAQALQGVPGGAETYFAVLTRSHVFDLDCLTRILQKPAAYVGMMGSRGRAALVRRQLLENGLDSQRIDALCAPIGLAIGAQTAAEIALSILAQVVSVKNARPQTEGFSSALLDAMQHGLASGVALELPVPINRVAQQSASHQLVERQGLLALAPPRKSCTVGQHVVEQPDGIAVPDARAVVRRRLKFGVRQRIQHPDPVWPTRPRQRPGQRRQ